MNLVVNYGGFRGMGASPMSCGTPHEECGGHGLETETLRSCWIGRVRPMLAGYGKSTGEARRATELNSILCALCGSAVNSPT
jgi:hypothetical protein